jgi:hypothetical protein
MRHYVWTHGVLRWGGFMLCFSLAVFQHSRFGSVFSTEGNLPFRVVVAALTWTFVGYLYGRSNWRKHEEAYLAQTQDPSGTFVP